ncbi:MAG TPA: TolC family protein [Candidatus Paceibacterota bacterium]|nr:TolC family protein [Verrucomicrobiota bacterium]HRY51289.1 TolC family protein [Candidatus Paceibacterota bacterium]
MGLIAKTTGFVLAGLVLTGCRGIPTPSEHAARDNFQDVRNRYRSGDRHATLPVLDTNATLEILMAYAMLNQPKVEAAYYDYAAAVERITTERSLPDPRLTLELDIQDVVTAVMPGLMSDVPWLKKLRIRADVASAESEAKFYAFESLVLQTAYEVKRAYYQLWFLDDRIRINRETLALLNELEQIARVRSEAGQVTLQDVLRAQIEQERLRTEIANLEDSRNPLLAQFKGALGLRSDQPDPPMPREFESTPLDLSPEQLLHYALARNPRLKQIEAEVRMAESGIRLARQSKLPDFNVGVEADVKASPVMWRPSVGVTLPVWRDKIAAEIAAAQARKNAAQARLSAEQIQLAVEFADRSFTLRETTRNLALLTDTLLPKARQSLEIARAAYGTAKTDFINLLDAERSLLEFQLAQVDARTQRELALAELSLLIVGLQPTGASLLGTPVADKPSKDNPVK